MIIETTPLEKLSVAVGGERDLSELEIQLQKNEGVCFFPPLPKERIYKILKTKKWERVLTEEELELIVKMFQLEWPELPPRLKEVARGCLTADLPKRKIRPLYNRALHKLRQFCRSYE